MAEVRIHLDFAVPSFAFRGLLTALVMLAGVDELVSESVSLTTYYPAPSGIYTQMISTNNTWLSRDGGSVVIGQNSAAAAGKLTLTAGSMSGTYGLTPGYANWAAYGTGSGGAAIYNDANVYRKLMIVGNNSAGGSREVGVWDNITINGTETVSGNETVNGNSTVNGNATVAGNLTITSGGGRRGYLFIDNSNTGCGGRWVNGDVWGNLCAANEYTAWNPGFYIEGWSYQARGATSLNSDGNSYVRCCPR